LSFKKPSWAVLLPGLGAKMAKKGWLILMWGILLLPLGFTIQAAALLKRRVLPLRQSLPILMGAVLTAVPDGFEIIAVAASILLATGLVPIGLNLVGGSGFLKKDEAGKKECRSTFRPYKRGNGGAAIPAD
jgi:hypothetical protein